MQSAMDSLVTQGVTLSQRKLQALAAVIESQNNSLGIQKMSTNKHLRQVARKLLRCTEGAGTVNLAGLQHGVQPRRAMACTDGKNSSSSSSSSTPPMQVSLPMNSDQDAAIAVEAAATGDDGTATPTATSSQQSQLIRLLLQEKKADAYDDTYESVADSEPAAEDDSEAQLSDRKDFDAADKDPASDKAANAKNADNKDSIRDSTTNADSNSSDAASSERGAAAASGSPRPPAPSPPAVASPTFSSSSTTHTTTGTFSSTESSPTAAPATASPASPDQPPVTNSNTDAASDVASSPTVVTASDSVWLSPEPTRESAVDLKGQNDPCLATNALFKAMGAAEGVACKKDH